MRTPEKEDGRGGQSMNGELRHTHGAGRRGGAFDFNQRRVEFSLVRLLCCRSLLHMRHERRPAKE